MRALRRATTGQTPSPSRRLGSDTRLTPTCLCNTTILDFSFTSCQTREPHLGVIASAHSVDLAKLVNRSSLTWRCTTWFRARFAPLDLFGSYGACFTRLFRAETYGRLRQASFLHAIHHCVNSLTSGKRKQRPKPSLGGPSAPKPNIRPGSRGPPVTPEKSWSGPASARRRLHRL